MEETNVVKSPLPSFPIPEEDIYTFIARGLKKNPGKKALIDAATGAALTYHEVQEKTERVAANLQLEGVKPGDVVAMFSPNSVEYPIIELAVSRLGGIIALISVLHTPGELHRMLLMTGAKFLYTGQVLASTSVKAVRDTHVQKVFINGSHPGCICSSTLMNPTPKEVHLPQLNIKPKEDIAILFFSSGTTGFPKAVEITHYNFVAGLMAMCHPSMQFLDEHPVCLYVPMSHLTGQMTMGALYMSATIVVMATFTLEFYIQILAKYKASTLYLVPPVAVMLTKTSLVEKYGISSHVTDIICGAAPLGAESEEDLQKTFGYRITIRQALGMTETAAPGTFCPMPSYYAKRKLYPEASVGVPVPNCDLKIIDENGRALGAGERGEICYRGPSIMKGYHGNVQETAATIDREGWLHSGDVGFYDDNKYFYVVDRIKDLIKFRAHQVAPAELEDMILSQPGVADVGVTYVSHPVDGEWPLAVVVKKPGANLTEQDVQQYVAERAAPHKKLRGGVKFVEVIPKSPSGKILRRILRDDANKSKM